MTVCELWDLTPPAMPPRSRLYHLEPRGVGTAAVESLTGYLARLAEAHCVSVRTLVVHELLPLLGRAYLSKRVNSSLSAFWLDGSRPLNGIRILARDWVQALETRTGRRDLRFLTLLTWAEVISATGLLRSERAWCPVCYEEWRRAGQVVYEPLLWNLQAVVACPRHRRRLQLQCPYPDCRQSQPLLTPHSRPGYCSRCQRWLGLSSESVVSGVAIADGAEGTESVGSPVLSEDEWRWQGWVGDAVGALLAAAPTLPAPPPRESIANAISACVEQGAGGKQKIFARELHLSSFAVESWTHGKQVPRLGSLLRVCHYFGTSPLPFLMDHPRAIRARLDNATVWNESPSRPRASRKQFDTEGVRRALETVLVSNETPPPPMCAVAQRLGYAHSKLHVRFRDLCRAISARYLAYRAARGQERIQQLCDEVREVAFRVHAQGLYPSAYRIASSLSVPGFVRHPDGMAAWHAALRDLGWEK